MANLFICQTFLPNIKLANQTFPLHGNYVILLPQAKVHTELNAHAYTVDIHRQTHTHTKILWTKTISINQVCMGYMLVCVWYNRTKF